ncbi:MAG: stage II sporulation protein P [Clostridia bacterium]|nr:stage II sporulation protein P [Clostridia bacterium]
MMDTDNKRILPEPETANETETASAVRTGEPEVPAGLPVPAPIPEEESPEEPRQAEIPHEEGRFRTTARVLLFRIFPSVLLAFAVTVYAVLSVTLLAGTDFSAVRLLSTMLGEFTGGADTIRFTELPLMEENTVTLPTVPPDTVSEPSKPLETPASEESAEPDFPVLRLDMSSSAPDALALVNETPYEPDLTELVNAGRAIPPYGELTARFGTDAPVVLILHTHATESYADTHTDDFRSTDTSENVTVVGKLIADRLTENGIGVLHCTELFDYPDFNMAYYNAALAIRNYIQEYPSISYILDIHRDSILSGEQYVNPVTEIGGESTAQIMFVVGTDHGGSGHTGWQDNLALAARLQKDLNSEYPSLMRDINLRSASFNEQYTSGSLLVEIGSCASTLDEVKRAAEHFADSLINEILEN